MTGPLLEGRTLGVGDEYIKILGQVETETDLLNILMKVSIFLNLPGKFLGNLINAFRLGAKRHCLYNFNTKIEICCSSISKMLISSYSKQRSRDHINNSGYECQRLIFLLFLLIVSLQL